MSELFAVAFGALIGVVLMANVLWLVAIVARADR